jgi:predicted HTH domain antitoxin
MLGVEGPIADPIFYKEVYMPQVTIPLSDNILTSLNMEVEEIAVSMRKEFALKSFHEGKITLAQGAAFCDMNIYDFISTLSQANIPVIDYSMEEVDRELAMLNGNC